MFYGFDKSIFNFRSKPKHSETIFKWIMMNVSNFSRLTTKSLDNYDYGEEEEEVEEAEDEKIDYDLEDIMVEAPPVAFNRLKSQVKK